MLHCRFEQIHPFLDGDGRTGRVILNLLLVRLGYPPAIIYGNERTAYLTYLRRADSGDCGALAEFLARAIFRTSLSSSSPPSLAHLEWCRWPRLRAIRSQLTPSGQPQPEARSSRSMGPMDSGAPRRAGSRTTCALDISVDGAPSADDRLVAALTSMVDPIG
jgi:hypothetical protein